LFQAARPELCFWCYDARIVNRLRTFAPLVALAAGIALANCSSGSPRGPEPRITIDTLEISAAQPPRTGTVPIVVRVSVTNTTQTLLTVDRIDVSSVGVGPYDIVSTAKDFHHALQAGHFAVFPVWVQASVSTAEQFISGQESSMVMRAVVFLSSPGGASRAMVVQRVDTTVSRRE
jgi:hypothetical protein